MPPVRRRPSTLVLLGAALLSAAACQDSVAPADAPLTADETRELARQIGAHVSNGFSFSALTSGASADVAALDATARAPFHVEVSDVEVPCPRGGKTVVTATADGTIDHATNSLVVDVTATQRPSNCGYDAHGKVVRVTGELTTTAHAELANGEPVGTHRVTVKGWFSWRARDGRHGTCSVDYTATANYTTKVATVDGVFCGANIHLTAPITS